MFSGKNSKPINHEWQTFVLLGLSSNSQDGAIALRYLVPDGLQLPNHIKQITKDLLKKTLRESYKLGFEKTLEPGFFSPQKHVVVKASTRNSVNKAIFDGLRLTIQVNISQKTFLRLKKLSRISRSLDSYSGNDSLSDESNASEIIIQRVFVSFFNWNADHGPIVSADFVTKL